MIDAIVDTTLKIRADDGLYRYRNAAGETVRRALGFILPKQSSSTPHKFTYWCPRCDEWHWKWWWRKNDCTNDRNDVVRPPSCAGWGANERIEMSPLGVASADIAELIAENEPPYPTLKRLVAGDFSSRFPEALQSIFRTASVQGFKR